MLKQLIVLTVSLCETTHVINESAYKIFYIMNRNGEVSFADLACLRHNNHIVKSMISLRNELSYTGVCDLTYKITQVVPFMT